MFSTVWKIRSEPSIKPVIARDTTCSVSLLTGTICGSNFAIPSTKIPAHGNGTEFPSCNEQSKQGQRSGSQPEVTRQPPRAGKGSGARASRSVSPAPETLNRNDVNSSGFPEAEFPEAGSGVSAVAVPRPSPGARQQLSWQLAVDL
jgi:hypothetical protein